MNVATKPRRAPQMEPDDRRRQLLEVAIHVFAEMGIDRATHGHVAKAAGVARPTVFAYFPTREELVTGVLTAVHRYMIDELVAPFGTGETYEERMAASGKSFIDATDSHGDHIKIWLMWSANFSEPVRSQYLEFEEEMIDRLARHLIGDAAGAPDAALKERTLIFIGAVAVLAQMAVRGEPRIRLEQYVRNVIQTLKSWVS